MHLHHSYKQFLFYILSFFWVCFFSLFSSVESYYFWLKSADNTPENIKNIEERLNIKLPVVSFIFDPWEESNVLDSIDHIVDLLGSDRVYHFTVSPNNFSAEEVVLWEFDNQYMAFFKKIKEKNLHVIFRTMHEMNGWWYSWSSNPEKFKAAWIHVWTLSRVVWLNEENIVFDFSVNHRDMPTKWTPSQSAKLIECSLKKKWCYRFEDYYPWDEFVDVIWFTFYNRWKAVWNRKWFTPMQILYDKNWDTYNRLKAFGKPIIIDEVATTSVWYEWNYNFDKSRKEYLTRDTRKDERLHQLREFLVKRPEMVAAIYFNTDYTHGLTFQVTWEADWAIVNVEDNKIYWWFEELDMYSEKDLTDILATLFHLWRVKVDDKYVFISPQCVREITILSSLVNQKAESIEDKIALVSKLQWIDFWSKCIDKSFDALMELYNSN